jgi:hypothetical protein
MSQHEFDNNQDGEWEDKGELAWNEFDWEKHLREHDREVTRFRQLYDELLDSPHHLDEIACRMGWESEEWSPVASNRNSVDPANYSELEDDTDDYQEEGYNEISEEDWDPCTLHRHPILIAQRGIVESFLEQVAQATNTNSVALSAIFRGLRKMEFNAFMALEALEVADYSLVIAHLKRGLNDVNLLFPAWERLCINVNAEGSLNESLLKAGQQRLFDLRELWLRVIHESREEIQNRNRENP